MVSLPKAYITARDNNGMTALHHAAVNGQADSLAVLVRAGGDVHAKDKQGRKAFDISKTDQVRRLLRDRMKVEL